MAAEETIQSFVDLVKVKAEYEQFRAMLASLQADYDRLSKSKIVIDTQGDGGKALVTNLKAAAAAQDDYTRATNSAVTAQTKLSTTAKEAAAAEKQARQEALEAGRQKILQLRQEQAELDKERAKEEELAQAERARLKEGRSTSGNTAPTTTKPVTPAFIPANELQTQIQYLQKTEIALAGVMAAQKQLKRDLDSGKISQAQYDAEINRAIQLELEYKNSITSLNASIKATRTEQDAQKGSLQQLEATLSRLRAEYLQLGIAERESVGGVQLQTQIKTTSDQVKALRETIGDTTKNVGNYGNAITGAFSKAFSVLRNIAYIIPGIGIAGLLSLIISPLTNFVSKLFEESDAAKKASEALKKHEEEVQNLIDSYRNIGEIRDSALGSTIAEVTEVQTLAGVVLNQANSYEERNKALEKLAKINKNYFGDLTLEESSLRRLKTVVDEYTNALIQQAVIKEVESDIGKVGAAFFRQSRVVNQLSKEIADMSRAQRESHAEDIKAGKFIYDDTDAGRKTAIKMNQLTLELHKQQDALKPLAGQYGQLKEELESLNVEALKFKPLDTTKGTTPKKPEDLTNEMLAVRERIRRAEIEFQKRELDEDAKRNEQIFNNEKLNLTDRLNAFERYLQDRQALIQIDSQLELKAIDDKLAEISRIEAKDPTKQTGEEKKLLIQKQALIAERQNVEADAQAKENDIVLAGANKRLDIIKQSLSEEDKKRQESLNKRLQAIDIEQHAELDALGSRFAGGSLTTQQFETEKAKIEETFALRRLVQAKKNAVDLFFAAYNGGQDTKKLEEDLANASIKLDDYITGKKIANAKKLKDVQKEFMLDVADAFKQFVGFQFDAEKNNIQDRIDTLEKQKQKDIEVANAQTGTAEQKAAAIALIEARAAAQRDQLEKKQKDVEVRKAQFEKLAALLEIAIKTATTVAKISADAAAARAQAALLAGNPLTAAFAPLSFAAAASIAAQIPFVIGSAALAAALIAARPIPKFGTGDLSDYEGFAEVGERGVSEVIVRGNGNAELTPAKSTLAYIQRNDKIYDSIASYLDSKNEFPIRAKLGSPGQANSFGNLEKVLKKELRGVKSAIENKPVPSVHNTIGGAKIFWNNGQSQVEWVNRNMQS